MPQFSVSRSVPYSAEQVFAVVMHTRQFAMDGSRCMHDGSAGRGAYALLTEANAEQGKAGRRLPHDLHRDAGLLGTARSG